MKKLFIIVALFASVVAMAQQKSTMETRALVQEYSKVKSIEELPAILQDQLAVSHDSRWGDIVRIVAKVSPSFDKQSMSKRGITVTSQVADIVAMRLPIEKIHILENDATVLQYTIGHKAVTCIDKARVDTRADSVQKGIGLPQGFNGEGVLVGITDWGFDYGHPNINSSAERRIFRAWDHFKLSGPAPAGFDYGTEFSTFDDLIAAGSDTSNIYQYNSHGTHVAGIIGGRGTKPAGNSASKFIGMAPKVQYLLGSWLLDEASWLDQVAWMWRVAQQEQKRLVINSSWGMYSFSDIDGTSLLSQAINNYSDSGLVFVTSGGNNGSDKFHIGHTFDENDTLRTKATYYPGDGGQMIICWGTPNGQPFEIGVALQDGNGNLYPTQFFSTSTDRALYESHIITNNDTIYFSVMTENSNPFSQRPHALVKVDKCQTRNYVLHVFLTAPQGEEVHIWNVNYVKEHESNVGMAFFAGQSDYTAGDNYYGIGEPACSEKAITVAAHTSGTMSADSTFTPSGIASFSSWGPALGGRNKPEISGPGVQVISSVSSYDPEPREVSGTINANGRIYKYATMSGTSMSCPAVTGIVALMLQANPRLTVDRIRDIIFTTAINDNTTGNILANDSISPRWGYGKINAYKAVNGALDYLSIEEATKLNIPIALYPNPATNQVTILTSTNNTVNTEIYTISGQKVLSMPITAEATIDLNGWVPGIYIVKVQDRTGIRTSKLVVR
ncbi:MAG: S8 family peptidase [Bacteroidales bacterium]|nr:S8 family peptidase [Bacteroidales bacterium]